jgi:ubiquinone/menaquinone biosynthesis C-methylase UbiE
VGFDVAAEAYDRFMGRYSSRLASTFVEFAGIGEGRVLDVGCGPGALTGELARRLGAGMVTAVDPSEPFVEAVRVRYPDVEVQRAPAEELPFPDDGFGSALAQLVVHFMADPVAGLGEMRRVTAPGGVVAACVWDHSSDRGPLSLYWRAARDLDPAVTGESYLAGTGEGELTALFEEAGLQDVEEASLSVDVEHPTFEEWWEPYTLGVGPAGAYVAGLDPERREALRALCEERLPEPPFVVTAQAWAARGRA